MLSPTSLVVLSAVSCVLTRANATVSRPDPCSVKAWVRADDLAPNTVSHGELKVKLIPPCPQTIASVTLRLMLDEYAEESTVSNTTTSGEFWDWQGDAPMAGMAEWISTKHGRTAWKIEKTLTSTTTDDALDVQDWASGVVFPFSVVSPNVNYPAAIHPLMFRGMSTETRRTVFGRGYRYTALVTLTGPDGMLAKNVEIPAGFTAFRPTSTSGTGKEAPREVTVEAIGRRDYWGTRCSQREVGEPELDEEAWQEEASAIKLRLRVTLPPGGNFMQGSERNVTIAVDGVEDGDYTTNKIVSGTLELGMALTSAMHEAADSKTDDYDPFTPWNRPRYQFQEIHALMWRTATDADDWLTRWTSISQPLEIRVPERFPRTAQVDASHDAPFRIEAFLGISVKEYDNGPHMNPLPSPHRTHLDGERRKAPATELGWEFGECDRAQFHKRAYFARIPVHVVGASQATSDGPATYYLDNGGRVPAPRIVAGHLSGASGILFDMADPVSVRDAATIQASIQSRDVSGWYAGMESMDVKAGHYVGTLWQSRLHGPSGISPTRPALPKMNVNQAVLQL